MFFLLFLFQLLYFKILADTLLVTEAPIESNKLNCHLSQIPHWRLVLNCTGEIVLFEQFKPGATYHRRQSQDLSVTDQLVRSKLITSKLRWCSVGPTDAMSAGYQDTSLTQSLTITDTLGFLSMFDFSLHLSRSTNAYWWPAISTLGNT